MKSSKMRRVLAVASLVVGVMGCNSGLVTPLSLVERSEGAGSSSTSGGAAGTRAAVLQDELRNDLYFLASERLEGRGVGTAGLDIASDFVAARFASLGLKPLPKLGGYFQPFDITKAEGVDASTSLAVSAGGKEDGAPLKLQEDFTAASFSAEKDFAGKVVFVGYGITDKERGYDDYAGLDVKGKVVLALRFEPRDAEGRSLWTHGAWTANAPFETKARVAAEHGAAALLLVNPYDAPAGLVKPAEKVTDLLKAPTDEDALMPFAAQFAGTVAIPFLHVKRTVAEELLKRGGAEQGLRELQARIDKSGRPGVVEMGGVSVKGKVAIRRSSKAVRNVVGYIPGNGPHADEYVIVGAHYDHLGWGGPGSGSLAGMPGRVGDAIGNAVNPHGAPATRPATTKPAAAAAAAAGPATRAAATGPASRPAAHGGSGSGRALHYGADDNGSGTVAMLELARIYSKQAATTPPDRSMIFVAFTAEESGLIGSHRFVNNPPVDLKKVVAMLNLDMVGRVQKNLLYTGGGGTAAPFKEYLKKADLDSPLEFKNMGDGGMGPSDHMSFAVKKVPVIFLFSGTHSDYHRPTDTPDKINYEGMAEVVRVGVELVDDFQGMPVSKYVDAADKGGMMNPMSASSGGGGGGGGGGEGTRRASLGIIPVYGDEDGKGVKIGGTTEGTAGEKAGLEGGDVVLELGGRPTGTLMELSAILASKQPGDKVKLVYQRGDKRVTTEVRLGERKG